MSILCYVEMCVCCMLSWLSPSEPLPLADPASLRVPGGDSDDETKTPSASPHHGRSRPGSILADSSSESDDPDARGEVWNYIKGSVILVLCLEHLSITSLILGPL